MGTIKWLTNCFTDVFTCHQESYARNQRCVQHHELRATDCYFLGGFVQSNLSKPCAIPSITFLNSLGGVFMISLFLLPISIV